MAQGRKSHEITAYVLGRDMHAWGYMYIYIYIHLVYIYMYNIYIFIYHIIYIYIPIRQLTLIGCCGRVGGWEGILETSLDIIRTHYEHAL